MNKLELNVDAIKIWVLIFILFAASSVFAAEYYVTPRDTAIANITDEGVTAWINSTNINTPCSAKTAFKRAVAGDIVFFRGGTYYLEYDLLEHSETYYWYNGSLNPTNGGEVGNPITFKAYPGELPLMDTKAFSSSRFDAPAFGCNYKSYITFDGFKFIGNGGHLISGIKMMHEDGQLSNITIKNCIFDGGDTPTSSTTNWVAIFAQNTVNSVVENCTFYNIRQTNNWHNTTAIIGYFNEGLVVRNSEFYDCSMAIYLKSANTNSEIYNNYIHDCFQAIFGAVYTTRHSDNTTIYNNVIAHIEENGIEWGSEETAHGNDYLVYNNTIYDINSKRGITTVRCEPGHGAIVYNNIVADSPTDLQTSYVGTGVAGYLKECDHNAYASPLKIITYNGGGRTYSSLGDWQVSGYLEGGKNPGVGSLVADPKFVNTSGNMSQLNDFQLAINSPLKGAGRNGSDIGAKIELVGILSRDSLEMPSEVQNFRPE